MGATRGAGCSSRPRRRLRIPRDLGRIFPNDDLSVGAGRHYVPAVRTEFARADYRGVGDTDVRVVRAIVLPDLDGAVAGSRDEKATVGTDVYAVQRADAGTLDFPHQRAVQSLPVRDLPIRAACQDLYSVGGELRHHEHCVSHEYVFPRAASVAKELIFQSSLKSI